MATKKLEYPFDLSTGTGLDITSIVIRETDGVDERNARITAKAKGEATTSTHEELISLSIVEVNGERVVPPANPAATWNTKTRQIVAALFNTVNGVEETELAGFLAQKAPRQTSSPSTIASSGATSSG